MEIKYSDRRCHKVKGNAADDNLKKLFLLHFQLLLLSPHFHYDYVENHEENEENRHGNFFFFILKDLRSHKTKKKKEKNCEREEEKLIKK